MSPSTGRMRSVRWCGRCLLSDWDPRKPQVQQTHAKKVWKSWATVGYQGVLSKRNCSWKPLPFITCFFRPSTFWTLQAPLYFIESFAGQAEASKAVQSAFPTRATAALDVKFTRTMDINTSSGMGILGWKVSFNFWLWICFMALLCFDNSCTIYIVVGNESHYYFWRIYLSFFSQSVRYFIPRQHHDANPQVFKKVWWCKSPAFHPTQSRAALVAVLRGDPAGFNHWMGVQCSTWVSTSRGSTGRSSANPLGILDSPCVASANMMVSRCGTCEQIFFNKSFCQKNTSHKSSVCCKYRHPAFTGWPSFAFLQLLWLGLGSLNSHGHRFFCNTIECNNYWTTSRSRFQKH